MKQRLSIALVAALIAPWIGGPGASDARSCRHDGSHNCFSPAPLDFSSVPEISKEIVGSESNVRPPPAPAIDAKPAPKPYTGPMIGVNSRVGAPTAGYYWSIH